MSGMAVSRPDHPSLLPALLAAPDPTDRVPRSARDWAVDIACFVLAMLFGCLMLVATSQGTHPPHHPPWLPDVMIGALGCLALWGRRRRPVELAVALGVLGTVSVTTSGAACIALFTVSVHRHFRTVVLVAGVHLLTGAIYALLFPDPRESFWFAIIWNVMVVAAIVASGMFVRARRQLILSLRERALRAEAEQQLRVAQARHQERARIAREMHDVLAHRISLLSVHAGALEFRPDAPPDEIAKAAGVIRASAHQALQDLREVIGVLRDDASGDTPERPQPNLGDLPTLIDESRRAGMTVTYENRLRDADAIPTALGRSAYRTVQEALTNARKHAPNATVTVVVDGSAGADLTVEVRNPLVNAASGIPGSGTGLIGLAERALLSGGRLEHGPTSDGEFRVRASLPWRGETTPAGASNGATPP
ncbi:sensor histidine kinase [Actinoallomurus soli]|uniref:sensor histidine kinase n=1 Tax=Actinoallomurus soli TaxID=2952535 RepID=UPI002093851B|nr:histidine kinase [Actinoallomurus soli]MCO5969345.1 histidine kinase [Actinoallomurus soli]